MAQDWLAEDILTPDQEALRDAVSDIAQKFDRAYWTSVGEANEYPQEYVNALTNAG